jgi:hypothetical protein
MRLLIVNFGLFTSIDVAESADVLIAIVESVGMFFLDSMDCNCACSHRLAESAGIPIALTESTGMCFLDAMNCCYLLLMTCVFICGQNFVSVKEYS